MKKRLCREIYQKDKTAFTLIELVMVIVIIGIVAVIAIPKFMDLQVKANTASDEATIGALKVAVSNGHLKNIMDGVGDFWPGSRPTGSNDEIIDPFSLLDPPVKSKMVPCDPPYPPGYWVVSPQVVGGTALYYMYCPHMRADVTSGRLYIYVAQGTYEGHTTGEIYLKNTYGSGA